MNPLKAIDAAILALHQWVVDMIQKQPRWCSTQCVIMCIVLFFLRAYYDAPSAFSTVMNLGVLIAMYFYVTRASQENLANTASWRLVFAIIPIFNVMYLFDGVTPERIIGLLSSLGYMSVYYFASCHPPRPRVPKTKLSMQGSS